MITLDERCSQILIFLMDATVPVKISELAALFKVSNRMIRYNLNTIDEFLKYNSLPQLIRKPNVGVKFLEPCENKEKVLCCLGEISSYQYSLSSKERIHFILSDLMQQRGFAVINTFAEKLSVSRSAIVKDLTGVKAWLAAHDLELRSVPKYGIKVVGEEKKLRRAAIELLTETIDMNQALEIVKSPVYHRIAVGPDDPLKKLFEDIDIDYIEQCIKKAEKELDAVFSDAAYSGIVIHIAIAIKRIQLGRDIVMPKGELNSLKLSKEFAVASELAGHLEEHYKLQVPVDEIGYITIHLLGASKSNLTNRYREDWLPCQLIAERIIRQVGDSLGLNLIADNQLFEGFLEHLQPTLYRMKHGLNLKNPLLDELRRNYGDLFQIVRQAAKLFEEYGKKQLNDGEIGYFVMHFAAAVERCRTGRMISPHILLVCGTGIGTANMLATRLQAVFDINIVDRVAFHQVDQVLQNRHVDLIVSTVPIQHSKIKSLMVNPLLTEQDIEKLKQEIKGIKSGDYRLQSIMSIIQSHCKILDEDKLIKELTGFLNIAETEEKKGVVQPLLKDLLRAETIKLNVAVKDWEEAVRAGGKLLEDAGASKPEYTDAMVDAVKNIGPYMVIAPGIAMPHARPEAGVNEIGMSLITLKNPVCFGNKENDPVHIVVCLCAIDHTTHLEALSDLVGLLGDENYVRLIMEATDSEVLVNLINS